MEYRLKSYVTDFRNRFGYNSSEPIDYISLLQKLDIITLFKPLSDDFSGLSIKSGNNKFMLVNSRNPVGRQNFTIGHELYHLYYDKQFIPHKCHTGLFPPKNVNERMADIFAAFLLLPEDGITQLIPEEELGKDLVKLSTLLKIEHTFSSSRLALLKQLEKMGLASKSYIDKYSVNIKSGAWQYGFSTDLYESTPERTILGTYGSLANKLYEEGKISEGHYQELMFSIGVDVNEIFINEES